MLKARHTLQSPIVVGIRIRKGERSRAENEVTSILQTFVSTVKFLTFDILMPCFHINISFHMPPSSRSSSKTVFKIYCYNWSDLITERVQVALSISWIIGSTNINHYRVEYTLAEIAKNQQSQNDTHNLDCSLQSNF